MNRPALAAVAVGLAVVLVAGNGSPVGAQPVASIALPPPRGTLDLYPGCNNIALSFPDGTDSQAVLQAVTPAGVVQAMWRHNAAENRFEGFSPAAPQASDLLTVNLWDAVWLCLGATPASVPTPPPTPPLPAPTATPAPPPAPGPIALFPGATWAGTTSQGRLFDFDISQDGYGVVQFRYGYQMTCTPEPGATSPVMPTEEGDDRTTFRPPLPIVDNAFSAGGGQDLTGCQVSEISGRFTSATTAEGEVRFRDCQRVLERDGWRIIARCDSGPLTWTASARGL
jgi:hypothetical protein